MGDSEIVQCEITGVHCSFIQFESNEVSVQMKQNRESISVIEHANITEINVGESCNAKSNTYLSRQDDIEYVCSENNSFDFIPLSDVGKHQLCDSLVIFCSFAENSKDMSNKVLNMEKPVRLLVGQLK